MTFSCWFLTCCIARTAGEPLSVQFPTCFTQKTVILFEWTALSLAVSLSVHFFLFFSLLPGAPVLLTAARQLQKSESPAFLDLRCLTSNSWQIQIWISAWQVAFKEYGVILNQTELWRLMGIWTHCLILTEPQNTFFPPYIWTLYCNSNPLLTSTQDIARTGFASGNQTFQKSRH